VMAKLTIAASDTLASFGGKPIRLRPWPAWPRADAGTERALLEVLYSGRWAISGAYSGHPCAERRFAEAFAKYNGVAYCVPTASGTTSLTLALLSLEIGSGDEVLIPGLTWVACASSVFCVGAVPILVDIEPSTLALSLDDARAAITDRTRAIMIVHPFCRLADIDGFVALSRECKIPLIEDCSQAHGACWHGRRVGSFGDIGCFSMQQSKVLTAGEGGAAITNDRRLYEKMEQLRSDGRLFSLSQQTGRLELVEVGEVQGQNMCLSEFQAAILLDRLEHLDHENSVRAERAALVEEMITPIEGVRVLAGQVGVDQTYYNIIFEVDTAAFDGNSIDAISRALTDELDVLVHPIYQPLNRHLLYNPLKSPRAPRDSERRKELDPARFHLPNAAAARRRCLSLPNFVLLDTAEGMRDIPAAFIKIQRLATELRHLPQGSSVDAF
jgi:dTDP-4-amino-4,6-dideoxygalactose transaminase